MLGKELKNLAEVADLARLDFEAAAITLVKDGDLLVARYQGAYSSGQRWLEIPDAPKMAVALSAMQFKSLAGLFTDEEEVEIIVSPGSIKLKSDIKDIDLSTRGAPEDLDPYEPKDPGYIEVQVATLLREAECASEFSARSMAKPVLTGLRLMGANGKLGIQSSDGISTLFETALDVIGKDKMEMITPAYDFVLGLRLIDEGTVKLNRTANHIVLYGGSAMFQSSLLVGAWPDFSRVRAPQDRQSVTIDSSLIRNLVQSVRILGTSNDLRLRGDGENLYLETIEAEAGSFEARIPSTIKGSYTFDVGSFLLAQSIGSKLVVQLPNEGNIPTLIESSGRRYWIAQKVA